MDPQHERASERAAGQRPLVFRFRATRQHDARCVPRFATPQRSVDNPPNTYTYMHTHTYTHTQTHKPSVGSATTARASHEHTRTRQTLSTMPMQCAKRNTAPVSFRLADSLMADARTVSEPRHCRATPFSKARAIRLLWANSPIQYVLWLRCIPWACFFLHLFFLGRFAERPKRALFRSLPVCASCPARVQFFCPCLHLVAYID